MSMFNPFNDPEEYEAHQDDKINALKKRVDEVEKENAKLCALATAVMVWRNHVVEVASPSSKDRDAEGALCDAYDEYIK